MNFDEWWIEHYGPNWGAVFSSWDKKEMKEAWKGGIAQAIDLIENTRVSVGNSAAGEMAAEWTMDNLREVRDELKSMLKR